MAPAGRHCPAGSDNGPRSAQASDARADRRCRFGARAMMDRQGCVGSSSDSLLKETGNHRSRSCEGPIWATPFYFVLVVSVLPTRSGCAVVATSLLANSADWCEKLLNALSLACAVAVLEMVAVSESQWIV